MKVATFNGTKVYNLSASGKAVPEWLSDRKKRQLAKDEEYRRRLELIQDFEVPTASQCIKMTKDKEHIIVTGTYPPIIKCYTVSDMSLKFQRGMTSEIVAFESLSDNFGKLVFLQCDRTLSFHAPYGAHYALRVPKFGRDLAYDWDTCDLYVAAAGNEIYRVNLEGGVFREPFATSFEGCNKVHINAMHKLLGCGGTGGSVELWDSRSRKAAASLNVASTDIDVTELKFDTDGLTLGVGTSDGKCLVYDIRSKNPLYTKEHQYGLPIVDISFHNATRQILSTDKKIIKIWARDAPKCGQILTNIETPADISAVQIVEDARGQSGLIFAAGEQQKIMSYFVPQLGPAPRWCSFLENITEELEESASSTVYEDYKFVTKAELADIGALALIGTPALKGYMHGYFIDMKLYNKLRAASKPFEYEEHRKKRIAEKIEEKRQSRITARKRLPKVNQELAEKMLRKNASEALVDDRFSKLFTREEFQQDTDSHDYKLRNPTITRKQHDDDSADELDDKFVAVDMPSYDSDDIYSSGDELPFKVSDHDSGSDSEGEIQRASRKKSVKMFELSAGENSAKALFKQKSKGNNNDKSVPLKERLKQENGSGAVKMRDTIKTIRTDEGLVREMSFVPSGVTKNDGLIDRRDDVELVGGREKKGSKKKAKR